MRTRVNHNHFLLVIETPQASLVAAMKWFLGTYTARFNRRHILLPTGHRTDALTSAPPGGRQV